MPPHMLHRQSFLVLKLNVMFQIYDAGDFSLLCSESSRRGERWVGGDFIALDRIIVWSNEGKAYLYKLPTK